MKVYILQNSDEYDCDSIHASRESAEKHLRMKAIEDIKWDLAEDEEITEDDIKLYCSEFYIYEHEVMDLCKN